VQVFVSAPEARANDVRALAGRIVSGSSISPENKPLVSLLHELDVPLHARAARRVRPRPLLVVLLAGGLLAWSLTRLGASPSLAVMISCSVWVLLSAAGALLTDEFSIFTLIQLGSYTLSAVLAFRPMTRWVLSKTRRRPAAV
jgi:hypothetical protein